MKATATRADSSAEREVTARGLVLGVILALVLGAANAYLGLYAGMTVSASIPAAVVSMAVLRGLGSGTILENNVVQTIASAGEALAAGAIFTFPALVILGSAERLPYLDVTALCIAGGVMGSLLVVFLRRPYVVEERLPFPEGLACAEVLRAGGESAEVRPLVRGGVLGAALKASQEIAGWIPGVVSGARWVGGAALSGSLNLSAALFGVGYIVGIQIAVLVFFGGAFAWLVAIPFATLSQPESSSVGAAEAASRIWSDQVRYLGVGAMLTGGLLTLWRLRSPIIVALGESIRLIRHRNEIHAAREDTDLSAPVVVGGTSLSVPVIFVLCYLLTGNLLLSATLALLLAVIGFFASAVAGYLTGIVGSSNNPVSGVTVIVLLAIALFLKIAGVSSSAGPALAIMVGAVVCTAAAMAGDSLHDLATGFHVGATPRSLEMAVALGAIVAALVMAPILNLLIGGYGITGTPTARAGALAAPQAFLMAKVAQGVFDGGLPWRTIAVGAGLAAVLGGVDAYLEKRGSRWRAPTMPVAIGLYLPFGLCTAILVGALARAIRPAGAAGEGSPGILFAAGLVAGEALMGVVGGGMVTAGIKLPLRL